MGERACEVVVLVEVAVRVTDRHAMAAYLLAATESADGKLQLPPAEPLAQQAAAVVAQGLERAIMDDADHAGLEATVLLVKPLELDDPGRP